MGEFESTHLNSANSDKDLEVDNLIKETLEESQQLKKESKEEEKEQPVLSATPIEKPKETLKPVEKPVLATKKEIPQNVPENKIQNAYDKTFKEYIAGDIVNGRISKIEPSAILVDIDYKAEGIITSDKLSSPDQSNLKVGDIIDVYIERLENKEGYVVLNKIKADEQVKWRDAYKAYKNKEVLEAKVINAVNGGLVVDCHDIRGFIPASQVAKKTETPLTDFVGKTIPIKIIQINRRQGKIVLSHKLGASEQKLYEKDKIVNELEIGQVKHGVVSSLKNFGAFVDIGGVDGLIHLSELSWKRVSHPSKVLKIGQEIDVFVLGVDKENKKVALGLKQLLPDPWVNANQKYKPGQIVTVKVARFTKFGAFVEIDEDLEGLIHISEISTSPIQNASDVLSAGQEIDAKILRILPEEQKIGLSIKQIITDKERAEIEKAKTLEAEKNKVTIGDAFKVKEKAKQEKEIIEESPGKENNEVDLIITEDTPSSEIKNEPEEVIVENDSNE